MTNKEIQNLLVSSRAKHDRMISVIKPLDEEISQIVDNLEKAYYDDRDICLSKEECELLSLIARFGILTYILSDAEVLLEEQTDIGFQ